jgi:phage tail sheath protein FI
MPVPVSYPGVYVEELPSAVRTITGVPTSITAFVGRAWRGPVDEPVKISSYADYERLFGGLWRDSTMSYAVQQFFSNGGSQAIIVRVATRSGGNVATAATFSFTGGKFKAASPGSWGMNLSVTVEDKSKTKDPADDALFNLKVFDDPDTKDDLVKRGGSGARESFLNVSVDPASPRFVTKVLEQQSQLLRVDSGLGTTTAPGAATHAADATSGTDGTVVGATEVTDASNDGAAKTGMYALRKTDIFNLLCIPPYTPTTDDNGLASWTASASLCKERRAFLIVDGPASWKVADGVAHVGDFSAIERSYAAVYFPRLRISDPLQDGNLADFAPSGSIAGIMSRTDAERGVWKAPAGIEASLRGVLGLSVAGLPGTLTTSSGGRARSRDRTSSPRSGSTCPCAASRSTSRRASCAARSGWCSSPTTNHCGRRSG